MWLSTGRDSLRGSRCDRDGPGSGRWDDGGASGARSCYSVIWIESRCQGCSRLSRASDVTLATENCGRSLAVGSPMTLTSAVPFAAESQSRAQHTTGQGPRPQKKRAKLPDGANPLKPCSEWACGRWSLWAAMTAAIGRVTQWGGDPSGRFRASTGAGRAGCRFWRRFGGWRPARRAEVAAIAAMQRACCTDGIGG